MFVLAWVISLWWDVSTPSILSGGSSHIEFLFCSRGPKGGGSSYIDSVRFVDIFLPWLLSCLPLLDIGTSNNSLLRSFFILCTGCACWVRFWSRDHLFLESWSHSTLGLYHMSSGTMWSSWCSLMWRQFHWIGDSSSPSGLIWFYMLCLYQLPFLWRIFHRKPRWYFLLWCCNFFRWVQ